MYIYIYLLKTNQTYTFNQKTINPKICCTPVLKRPGYRMHNLDAISILTCALDSPCFLHLGSMKCLFV